MRRVWRALWIVIVLAILGGGAFLATWDIPPPTATVETVLPDDQFPQ
jgi:hypothetical protein